MKKREGDWNDKGYLSERVRMEPGLLYKSQGWADSLMDMRDAALEYIDTAYIRSEHKEYITEIDLNYLIKPLRKALGHRYGKDVPAAAIAAAFWKAAVARDNLVDRIKRQQAAKAAAEAEGREFEWKPIRQTQYTAQIKRDNPDFRRTIIIRARPCLDAMQKSIQPSKCPGWQKLKFTNLGWIEFKDDRTLPEDAVLTQVTLGFENGNPFLSLNWKTPKIEEKHELSQWYEIPDFTGLTSQEIMDLLDQTVHKFIGIDLGVNRYAVGSDDSPVLRFNITTKQEAYVAKLLKDAIHYNRVMAHKRNVNPKTYKTSKSYKRIKKSYRRVCDKIANIYRNNRYQTVATLKRENATVVMENLTVDQMMQGPLARKVKQEMGSIGLGDTIGIAIEKLGDRLVLVDPAYTSQRCSVCVDSVSRSNRPTRDDFRCRKCGFAGDADRNAAVNVLAAGIVAEPRKFVFKAVPEAGPKGAHSLPVQGAEPGKRAHECDRQPEVCASRT